MHTIRMDLPLDANEPPPPAPLPIGVLGISPPQAPGHSPVADSRVSLWIAEYGQLLVMASCIAVMDMYKYRLLLVALTFASLTEAFKSFDPNCSLPSESVNYVFPPGVRGTMPIVWGCLSALLLCTWTVQHLAVPIHTEDESRSWHNAFQNKMKELWPKAVWMSVTLLIPEYVLGKALTECLAAHHSRREFGHPNWTVAHAYFANMRGFVLRFEVAAVKTSLIPSKGSERGRSLQKPRPNGKTPYFKQSVEGSRLIELEQCHKLCGVPCSNQVRSSKIFKYDATQENGDVESQKTQNGVEQDLLLPTKNKHQKSSFPSALETIHSAKPPTRMAVTPDSRPKPRTATSNESMTGLIPDAEHSAESIPVNYSNSLGNNLEMRRLPSLEDTTQPTITKLDDSRAVPDTSVLDSHKLWKGTWPLNAMQMHYAFRKGIIAGLPPITAEELSDRSKGDALINFAAIFQITWLIVQIIARAFQNLAITLFEITVLAFAACALVTYILFWQKPQDVNVPVYVDAAKVLTRENVISLAARSPVSSIFVYEFWLHGVAIRGMGDNVFPTSPGIPFKLPWMKERVFLNPVIVGVGLGGSIFGAIHFAAWNFEFPTSVERIMWRASCCILFSFPLLATLIYWMIQRIVRSLGVIDKSANRAFKPVEYIMVLLYLAARLYLCVEIFRSLAYLPPSVFKEVQWPNAIPHVN